MIAVCVTVLMTTRRGRELFDRGRGGSDRAGGRGWCRARGRGQDAGPSRAILSEGSIVFACLVGALLAVPGPFDLLALGRLARNGYGLVAAGGVMVVFRADQVRSD